MNISIEDRDVYLNEVRNALRSGKLGLNAESIDQQELLIEGKDKIYHFKIKFWRLFKFISGLGVTAASGLSVVSVIFLSLWIICSLKGLKQDILVKTHANNYYRILKKLHDSGASLSLQQLHDALSLPLSEVDDACEELWKCEILSENKDGFFIIDSYIEV